MADPQKVYRHGGWILAINVVWLLAITVYGVIVRPPAFFWGAWVFLVIASILLYHARRRLGRSL